jgi:hypothetical protein
MLQGSDPPSLPPPIENENVKMFGLDILQQNPCMHCWDLLLNNIEYYIFIYQNFFSFCSYVCCGLVLNFNSFYIYVFLPQNLIAPAYVLASPAQIPTASTLQKNMGKLSELFAKSLQNVCNMFAISYAQIIQNVCKMLAQMFVKTNSGMMLTLTRTSPG